MSQHRFAPFPEVNSNLAGRKSRAAARERASARRFAQSGDKSLYVRAYDDMVAA